MERYRRILLGSMQLCLSNIILIFLGASEVHSVSFCDQHKTVFISNLTGVITDGPGKYQSDQRCEWLIISPDPVEMPFITLKFTLKKTECKYDYIMVHDGDSNTSPLLSSVSGDPSTSPEYKLTATSGKMLVYLFSDFNTEYEGFRAEFSISACPNNCSYRGVCHDRSCHCDGSWIGRDCSQPLCPQNCQDREHGDCEMETGKCICNKGFIGLGCEMRINAKENAWGGSWKVIYNYTDEPGSEGRAGHAGVYIDPHFYIFGGYDLNKPLGEMLRYSFKENEWLLVKQSNQPSPRFFHTMTAVGGSIFLHGGDLGKNELSGETWIFDTHSITWSMHTTDQWNSAPPPPLCQHAAALVQFGSDHFLYIYGGRTVDSPEQGLSSLMYRFSFSAKIWQEMNYDPSGVKSSKLRVAGHSMVYDPVDGSLVVFGGFRMNKSQKAVHSSSVFLYNVLKNRWAEVVESGTSREFPIPIYNIEPLAFHSANVVGDYMVVHGGYMYINDCYHSETHFYNLRCQHWVYPKVAVQGPHPGCFSHASALINDSILLIHGGYNGMVLSDLLAYKLPLRELEEEEALESQFSICGEYTEESCNVESSNACVWKDDACISDAMSPPMCGDVCSSIDNCVSCTSFSSFVRNSSGIWQSEPCAWCVEEAKCFSANTEPDKHTPCSTKKLKRSFEPWWGNQSTIIQNPDECLAKNIPPGLVAAEYYPNPNYSMPDNVSLLKQAKFVFPHEKDKKITSNITHSLIIRGFIHPHQLTGDHFVLKLISAQGKAEMNMSLSELPSGLKPVAVLEQTHTKSEKETRNIMMSSVNGSRCFMQLQFTHSGDEQWQGRVEVEWDSGFLRKIYSNENRNFKALRSDLLEPFQSSLLPLSENIPRCKVLTNCLACLTDMSCAWCDSRSLCKQKTFFISYPNWCSVGMADEESIHAGVVSEPGSCTVCGDYPSCRQCVSDPHCEWHGLICLRRYMKEEGIREYSQCPDPCHQHSTCRSCVLEVDERKEAVCSWCPTMNICYKFTSHHLTAYPFGQCARWINKEDHCPGCAQFVNCSDCLAKYQCGWCSNASNPLQGYCTEGGFSSPYSECRAESLTPVNDVSVSDMLWSYFSCPDINECELEWPPGQKLHHCHENARCVNAPESYICQCMAGYTGNGQKCERTCLLECMHGRCSGPPQYQCICDLGWTSLTDLADQNAQCDIDCECNFLSTCNSGPGICDDCQLNTSGPNCDECALWHFRGDRIEDGCLPCLCNGHGREDQGFCDQDTGNCSCEDHTTGPNCELCEDGYYGDPRNGGTCYQKCDGRSKIDLTSAGAEQTSGAFGSWKLAKREMGSLLRRKTDGIDVKVVNCEWNIISAKVEGYDPTIKITIEKEIRVPCYTNQILVYDGIPGTNGTTLLGVFCGAKWERNVELYAKSGIATVQFTDVLPFLRPTTGFNATFQVPYPIVIGDLEDSDMENSADFSGNEITEPPIGVPQITLLPSYNQCLNQCNSHLGQGFCKNNLCHCSENYGGEFCEIERKKFNTALVTGSEWNPSTARAVYSFTKAPNVILGHTTVAMNEHIWLFGGFLPGVGALNDLWRYDTINKSWTEVVSGQSKPPPRYFHASSKHPNKTAFYIHGGITNLGHSSELWLFDNSSWKYVNMTRSLPSLAGHTMTFCGGMKAYIIGGYNFNSGYNQNVWKFDALHHTGHPVHAKHVRPPLTYGHVTVCDWATETLYVHGGLKNSHFDLPTTADLFYSFNPSESKWHPIFVRGQQPLHPAPRAFHSAAEYHSGKVRGFLMFGGKLANDMSQEIWLFLFSCNVWIRLRPEDIEKDGLAREKIGTFASVAKVDESYYVYGGVIHGLMTKALVKITDIKPCFTAVNAQTCSSLPTGCKICTDENDAFVCLPRNETRPNHSCVEETNNELELDCQTKVPVNCSIIKNCKACVSVTPHVTGNSSRHNNCHWCPIDSSKVDEDGMCRPVTEPCPEPDRTVTSRKDCNHCSTAPCTSCNTRTGCHWQEDLEMNEEFNKIMKSHSCDLKKWPGDWDYYLTTAAADIEPPLQPAVPIVHDGHTCPTACNIHSSCSTCLGFDGSHDRWRNCIWSPGLNKCLDPSFVPLACPPGGNCGILASKGSISCPALQCASFNFCWECINNHGCGWLQEGTTGKCVEGSSEKPTNSPDSSSVYWWYFECPAENECQMGWHDCLEDHSNREQCQDSERGFKCVCQSGYGRDDGPDRPCTPECSKGCIHGECTEPENCKCKFGYTGDRCDIACQCNGHSECKDANHTAECIQCQNNTTGKQCNHCQASFVGDPTKNITCVSCREICENRTETCVSKSSLKSGEHGPTPNDVICIGCRYNSQGDRCNECKDGFFMLNNECRPCECNGHSSTCDRRTGGFCDCKNHTVTSDPKCDVHVEQPSQYPSHCWSSQCDKCMEPYEGNAQNGGHCYRKVAMEQEMCFNPENLSPCMAESYVHETMNTYNVLSEGQAILFALSPKYTNVDIRLMIDITFGEVTLFLSDKPDTFIIKTNHATKKHTVQPNKRLVELEKGSIALRRKRKAYDPNRSKDPGQNKLEESPEGLWWPKEIETDMTFQSDNLKEYLKQMSRDFNRVQRHTENSDHDGSDTSTHEPEKKFKLKKKLRLIEKNGTNFNSFASLPPGTALIAKNVRNRLVVSIPHMGYELRLTKFYVILLGGLVETPVRVQSSFSSLDDDRDSRAIVKFHPVDKTAGLLLFRQDQTHINLFVFFSVFFSCFFLFLAICIVTWKVKQYMDLRNARITRHFEMRQMASRPFACVYVTLPKYTPDPLLGSQLRNGTSDVDISSTSPHFTRTSPSSQLFQAQSCPIFKGPRVSEDGPGTSGSPMTTLPEHSSTQTLGRKPFQRRMRRKISARRGVDCMSLDLTAHSAPQMSITPSEDILSAHELLGRKPYSTGFIDSSSERLLVSYTSEQKIMNKMPLLNSTAYIKEVSRDSRVIETKVVPGSRTPSPSLNATAMKGVETESYLIKGGKVRTISRPAKSNSTRLYKAKGDAPSRTNFCSTPTLFQVNGTSSRVINPENRTTPTRTSSDQVQPNQGKASCTRISSRAKTKQHAKKQVKTTSKAAGIVACEPTDNGVAAVNTVLLQLPGGSQAPVFACLGSAIVMTKNICYPCPSDTSQLSKPHFKSRSSKLF